MDNLTSTKLNFSQHLSEILKMKYKKQVSVVFFVNQFNLRAYGTNTIAYETGRKWLKGLAVPQLSKLKVLIEWLDLDPNYFFMEGILSSEPAESWITNNVTSILSIQDNQSSLRCIQDIFIDLDTKSQHFLLLSALTLHELAGRPNFD